MPLNATHLDIAREITATSDEIYVEPSTEAGWWDVYVEPGHFWDAVPEAVLEILATQPEMAIHNHGPGRSCPVHGCRFNH